jgi:hypothetical protein
VHQVLLKLGSDLGLGFYCGTWPFAWLFSFGHGSDAGLSMHWQQYYQKQVYHSSW